MASLRDLALKVLADRASGTPAGTPVEHLEQAFHQPAERSRVLEHQERQNIAKNEPCSSVPRPRERNSGTPTFQPNHAPKDCRLYHPRMILAPGECFCDPVPGYG